jgi:hypothetical protein
VLDLARGAAALAGGIAVEAALAHVQITTEQRIKLECGRLDHRTEFARNFTADWFCCGSRKERSGRRPKGFSAKAPQVRRVRTPEQFT